MSNAQAQFPPNTTCGEADLSALQRQLHNVVVVVNIRERSSVNKEVTQLLRGVYGRIFDTLVLLGPVENKALQVEGMPSSLPPPAPLALWPLLLCSRHGA